MTKKDKSKIVITTIITLLPIIAGIVLWDKLPNKIPIHWDINGEADGWGSKGFAVFGIPILLAVFQITCSLLEYYLNNNQKSNIAFNIVIWIFPVMSILANAYIYMQTLGITTFKIERILPLVLGIFFVIIGNYLPKFTQSRTLGIKLKWTLESEDNWYATHRLGGRLWVIGGILLMLSTLLPSAVIPYTQLAVIILMILIPTVYSYVYSKKHKSDQ